MLDLGYLGTMMGVNNFHMGKYLSLVFLPNIWGGDVNINRIYALKGQLPTTYETHTSSLIVMRSAARLQYNKIFCFYPHERVNTARKRIVLILKI